jgi:maleylacetate reductase
MIEPFVYEQVATRVVFGVDRVAELADELDHLDAKRVLVITSRSARDAAGPAVEGLGERLAHLVLGARAHVPLEDVESAREVAARLDTDCLVAIGGGSSIGLAKAVALDRASPIVAVPTTYSGSEMTPFYGITSRGRKHTGRAAAVQPRVVLYDPALTTTLPPAASASTGMNAVAHCVEALYAPDATPVGSLMAEEGIRCLARGLPASIADPNDTGARSVALYGAFLAGSALAATTMGLHHRICHVLGGTFGLPHGDANAVMLPHVARFNAEAAPDALGRVASALSHTDAVAALSELRAGLGAPSSLEQVGMDEHDMEEAARLSVDPPPANPRPVDLDDVLAMLREAM